jgi:hypothetical protein
MGRTTKEDIMACKYCIEANEEKRETYSPVKPICWQCIVEEVEQETREKGDR